MESSVADLIQRIQSADAGVRLAALEELRRMPVSDPRLVRFLGRLAMDDPEPLVRAAALRVLALPQYQAEQRKMSRLPEDLKARLLPEIQTWEDDGVITPLQAELLRSRMGTQPYLGSVEQAELPVPPSEAQPAAEIAAGVQPPPIPSSYPAAPENLPAGRGSVSQLLLSETSIKVALFLGAFFVLAAAMIVMALVEVSRLPILGVLTAGFFIVALLLAKRLPLASIVLYGVGVLLLPILGVVIISTLHPDAEQTNFMRAGTALVTGLAAMAGALRYRSRWLILLGWLAFILAVGFLIAGISSIEFRLAVASRSSACPAGSAGSSGAVQKRLTSR